MVTKKKSGAGDKKVLQLKVQLLGVEPEIWRRVLVPPALTLRELHAVIQGAMGWQDCHLHMFEIGDKRFEVPEDDRLGPEDGYDDERKRTLKAVVSKGTQFLYVYDFGDDWRHVITVEDTAESAIQRCLPLCVDGARACPPEDCGGIYSYPEFLGALTDPAHPEHQNTVDWARGFEPEAFNITQANGLIQAVCALYRERGWGFYEGQTLLNR